jgi:hypothetical protein
MTPMERAERIVTVELTMGGADWNVMVDGERAWMSAFPELAHAKAKILRDALVKAMNEAVAAHLASVVPEGPVSEGRLVEIRKRQCCEMSVDICQEQREAILAAHDHLRSLCARLLNDDPIGQYQAGLEHGRRETAKAVELLRSLEWSGTRGMYDDPACPCCDAQPEGGAHRDGCALAALLED